MKQYEIEQHVGIPVIGDYGFDEFSGEALDPCRLYENGRVIAVCSCGSMASRIRDALIIAETEEQEEVDV